MTKVLLSVLLLLAPASGFAQDRPAKALKIKLKKQTFKKGQLRLGFEVAGPLLPIGYKGMVGKDTLIFFDLNRDGRLEPEKDGVGIPSSPFVVRLPEKLLLGSGQFQVAFKGAVLYLLPEDLGDLAGLIPDAALVNELRIRAGLRPVHLDRKASNAAEKHCEYLKLNGLADGSGGVSAHKETPGKPGYSPEGKEAGEGSSIYFGYTLREAILGWHATAWHGAPIVDPELSLIGVAHKHGVSLLYFAEYGYDKEAMSFHPPDGAIRVPRSFGKLGEIPNPVPGTLGARGCGFPILAHLTPSVRELKAAKVLGPGGKPVEGTFSSPARPANPQWPSNSDIAVFIPSKPLAPGATYRVTFTFAGVSKPVTWTFTTVK